MAEERRKDDPLNRINRPQNPRSRKNTRKWCKGKVGVEHKLVFAPSKHTYSQCGPQKWAFSGEEREFEFAMRHPTYFWSNPIWGCGHQIECEKCGKVIEYFMRWYDCPDLPADLEARVKEYQSNS